MNLNGLIRRVFPERSFSLPIKLTVFSTSAAFSTLLAVLIFTGFFKYEEIRLLLYVFHIIIFVNTFFCGFFAGIAFSFFSSLLATVTLMQAGPNYQQPSFSEFEIFPFISLYFLIAITVEWFRENIERLKRQLEENKKLHDQAQHMEKLALAGEIAAGIAHEIRNPLTVIQGYLQLITGRCKKLCNSEDAFTLLLDELKRANQIIADFLRFCRPDVPKKERVQLNDIMAGAVSLLYGEALRKNVRIDTYPAADLPELCLDKSQITQIFLNLFTNALQAMPDGGTLSVHTSYNITADSVEVTVGDSGVGMPPGTISKIFTPFFTTKENGTGLGLAITQTIIYAHGGLIHAESIPGQGTKFIITLPVNQNKPMHGPVHPQH